MVVAEGGCGDVEHEVGLLRSELVHWADGVEGVFVSYIPDVFANG